MYWKHLKSLSMYSSNVCRLPRELGQCHDLENLDSEIAVLQQSLKRIVTGPAPTEGAVPTAWGSGTREAPAAVDYEQPTKEVEL